MESAGFALDASFLLLAACVALAYTAEAATGFGSIVIALTLGAQLYPVPALLPILVPLSVMLTTTLVARNWRHVDRALLLRRLLPRMGAGLVAGVALFTTMPGAWLTPLLGVFVIGAAGLELWRALAGRGAPGGPLGPVAFTGVTFGAGVVQGLAASGGPVLVYALGRLALPKARFRATLSVVWLTLNSALVVTYLATGRLDRDAAVSIGLLVPVVVGALALGDWLHGRLDEEAFRRAVLVLLTGAGAALVV